MKPAARLFRSTASCVHTALVLAASMCAVSVWAGEVKVAVAANFSAPMQKIAQQFQQETGHKAVLSLGSTGGFYAQIKNGAPFEVLLSADDETPERLEKEGFGVSGTRFTYAIGRLALWSKTPDFVDERGEVLKSGGFNKIAMANPRLAPYGAAAQETLTQLGLLPALQGKIVQGDNIAQTFQFVQTENAALGFVALSQVYMDGRIAQGSAWIVPARLHSPLKQDAVLLTTGKDSAAAKALLAYLKSEPAKAVMSRFGYEVTGR